MSRHEESDVASRADDAAVRSARAFRVALTALSEPGRIVETQGLAPAAFGPPPAPISLAAASLLELLADPDAPYWLGPERSSADAQKRFSFLCGAAPATAPGAAHYLLGGWSELARHLGALRLGTPERPDLSATLIVECRSLDGGPQRWVSGPGVDGAREIAPDPGTAPDSAPDLWSFLEANARRFPLGVDVYLCAGAAMMGLPRTATVSAATPAQA